MSEEHGLFLTGTITRRCFIDSEHCPGAFICLVQVQSGLDEFELQLRSSYYERVHPGAFIKVRVAPLVGFVPRLVALDVLEITPKAASKCRNV